LYQANEQAPNAGLYRCTTCGVMIPLNAAEKLPACPTRCADVIWTFFNEKFSVPQTETREAVSSFAALDLSGDPQPIPVGARLSDVRLGPEPQGKPGRDPDLAAFRFDGKVYFSSAAQVIQNSKLVSTPAKASQPDKS
jgi:hypothetical protein